MLKISQVRLFGIRMESPNFFKFTPLSFTLDVQLILTSITSLICYA